MKVHIGKYKSWFGPYQLADALCFWVKEVEDEYGIKDKPDWVHKFGEFLAHGSIKPEPKVGEVYKFGGRERPITLLYKFLLWLDRSETRKVKVRIDPWDTWNFDTTLVPIILPMLKQLKETKHGSAIVDPEDVPEYMRTTTWEDYDAQSSFEFYHEDVDKLTKTPGMYDTHDRWDWVLDEMIFTFEHLADDSWEDEFRSGEHDLQLLKLENGTSQMIEGPNDTYKCDYEGMRKVQKRINNGLILFGKYFKELWD